MPFASIAIDFVLKFFFGWIGILQPTKTEVINVGKIKPDESDVLQSVGVSKT